MEWVVGGDGAEDCLQHQHRGDKSLEHVHNGGGFGKIPHHGVFSADVGKREEVRGIIRNDGCRVFVDF